MTPYRERVVVPYDDVRVITVKEMTAFVTKYHYSKIMPRITKVCYGGFRGTELVAAISFGLGTFPLATIQKRFPSLTTNDYQEIGKLCLKDSEPENSESHFIAVAQKKLHKQFPNLKLLFTWADGIWGRVGTIYQATNFLYGDFIWTDRFQTENSECVHPRSLRKRLKTSLKTQRPNFIELTERRWKRYRGKQFAYVLFLCDSKKEQERLKAESTVKWTDGNETPYPKELDLEWEQYVGPRKWIPCGRPEFAEAWDSRERSAS